MRAQGEFTDYLPILCFSRVNLTPSQRWFERLLNGTSQVRSSSVLEMLSGHFDVLAGDQRPDLVTIGSNRVSDVTGKVSISLADRDHLTDGTYKDGV